MRRGEFDEWWSVVILLASSPLTALLSAAAIRDVWLMYVTEAWGIAAPSLVDAYGVMCLVGLVTYVTPNKAHDKAYAEETPSPVARAWGLVFYRTSYLGLLWAMAAGVHAMWGS